MVGQFAGVEIDHTCTAVISGRSVTTGLECEHKHNAADTTTIATVLDEMNERELQAALDEVFSWQPGRTLTVHSAPASVHESLMLLVLLYKFCKHISL